MVTDFPDEARGVKQRWPDKLWIVRHGQSAGNVAKDAAYSARSARIEIEARDVDVPLSKLGKEQSEAVGKWFAAMPEAEKPQVLLTSPYARARQTGEAIRAGGGLAADASDFIVDERLREKELGALDRLTRLLGASTCMPKQVIALPSVKVRLDFSLTKSSRRCQGLWLTFQRPPLRELPKTAPRARIVTLHRWRRLDFSSSPSAMIWVIPRTVLTVLTAPGRPVSLP